MQAIRAFHLWPRLHQDLLGFLDLTPPPALDAGATPDLGQMFRHVAAVEDYWRRTILEREAEYREIPRTEAAGREAIRGRLAEAFAGTEELLRGSLVDALVERPVQSAYPVKNALEALTLCHLHTVHHRAEIALSLRALGCDPHDWV